MYAKRMERLGTETAFEVLARARELEKQGRDIVHLEIGEPDFDTPRFIGDAAVEALRDGYTHYGPSAGLPEVREVFADYIARTRGLSCGGEHVVVTPGAKPIIFFTMLACVEEGDEVIYPDPGFPIYESMVHFLGARPVPLKIREENGFSVDLDELRSLLTDRTRFLILNSPANPTGGVLERDAVEAIAEMVRDRNLWVLSDEIYSRILYEGTHQSIASLPGMQEKTIILDGHSKTYAMTGWRLGYGVMPTGLAAHVTRLMTNSNSCTNVFVQRAGMKAIQGPQGEVDTMVAEFRRRRDVIVDGLNAIPGMRCLSPKGAFYAFPSVKDLPLDSKTLARDLLDQGGVAVLSGTAFGAGGAGFLRFSYANSVVNIQ
ncbi:MAG: pyridoxal phosphate-dependent aminotransferase [Candidatus Eisenbacteria bacterium]